MSFISMGWGALPALALTGMPEFVLMPAPVMTTTFRALNRESAIPCRRISSVGVTWVVGILKGVLESAHWTVRSGVPTIRHCYYDADGLGASDNNATRTPDFVNLCSAREIERLRFRISAVKFACCEVQMYCASDVWWRLDLQALGQVDSTGPGRAGSRLDFSKLCRERHKRYVFSGFRNATVADSCAVFLGS